MAVLNGRSRVELFFSVLDCIRSIKTGIGITRLIHCSNFNYIAIRDFLDYGCTHGLIAMQKEKSRVLYFLTADGSNLLGEWWGIKYILRDLLDDSFRKDVQVAGLLDCHLV